MEETRELHEMLENKGKKVCLIEVILKKDLRNKKYKAINIYYDKRSNLLCYKSRNGVVQLIKIISICAQKF